MNTPTIETTAEPTSAEEVQATQPETTPAVPTATKEPVPVVNAFPVAYQIQTFDIDGAPLWFRKFEIIMRLQRIENIDWNDHLLCVLLKEHTDPIAHLMAKQPEEPIPAYQWLKDQLIEHYGLSKRDKVRALLGRQTMGDMLPSAFLHHLRTVLPTDTSPEVIREK